MANIDHSHTPVFCVEKIFIFIHPNVSEPNVVNGFDEFFVTFKSICVMPEYMAYVRAGDYFYRTTAQPRLHPIEKIVNRYSILSSSAA